MIKVRIFVSLWGIYIWERTQDSSLECLSYSVYEAVVV